MAMTEISRQVVERQLTVARRKLVLCKILCTALFVAAGYLVASLSNAGHAEYVLLLIFALAVAIAAIGHAYTTAEELVAVSIASLHSFERIERLR